MKLSQTSRVSFFTVLLLTLFTVGIGGITVKHSLDVEVQKVDQSLGFVALSAYENPGQAVGAALFAIEQSNLDATLTLLARDGSETLINESTLKYPGAPALTEVEKAVRSAVRVSAETPFRIRTVPLEGGDFIIIALSFFVIRLAPGGPFDEEQTLPPEVKANLEAAYGLDKPLPEQFVRYLGGLAQGDFGPSYKFKDFTVTELIAQGLPVSLMLGLSAVLLALLVGIPLGTLAALRQNSPTDYGIMAVAVLGIALPSFVTGPLFALIFGLHLRWFPVAGWEAGEYRYLVLPVITLSLPVIAYIARLTRGSLLEVLRTNFVRTARAKGLAERQVILRHALRPALLPVVSYLGPATAFVITGSLVVETVFGLPGSGRYLVQGAINRDYTLVMGMIVVYGGLTLTLNLLADLLYGWLDPRVRYD